jgi:ribosomal protein L31
VGVITKSKKPSILQELPEIGGLMARAEATGRWVNLGNVFGRLPSDASRAADISVGIGISTAANEAVAAEGKAVHCDLTAMHSHPFYEWGYEKVVFDDLGRMMEAFKRRLADPSAEPGLGDFSPHIDQVDPFMDGRAGERIGSYIGTLIKGFEAGLTRRHAIAQANQRYAQTWGGEHVREHGRSPSPIRT